MKIGTAVDSETVRSPVTILFSDIQGSSSYFEKKGDVEGVSMLSRHNQLLFPVIESAGGRIVKTIGDSIMACFEDPEAAVTAASGMQRALAEDRRGRPEIEQIHIRVGLHMGMGVIKDGDVFGDVVNAAARVQRQAEPDQVLITDVLCGAATSAGFDYVKLGRAEMRGKDEPIEVYAIAWSDLARQQLLEHAQAQYEKKLKELKHQQTLLEDEFESARSEWRTERRNLIAHIEELEDALERTREGSLQQVHEDLQSELRFQLDLAIRERDQRDQDLASAQQRFEAERNNLKAQIAAMQASVIEAMERSNNPARLAAAVREQVEARLAQSKKEWELQWDGERRRLEAQIEQLKKPGDQRKEAARRAILEKLGKIPASASGPAFKTAEEWEREYEDARIQWETERDQLRLQIGRLESELGAARDSMRNEITQELRTQYEVRLAEAARDRNRLEQDIQSLANDLASERLQANDRIKQLENAIAAAQEATRKQVIAEIQFQFDTKLEETGRLQARSERKLRDAADEWETEHRRLKKQIASLEEQLREAKDAAFRAQKALRAEDKLS